MRGQFIVLFIVLEEFRGDGRKNSQFCGLSFGLFKFSKNILQHLRFAIVLVFDGLEDFDEFRSDVEGLFEIQHLFFALLLEISPLSINTFVKFIRQSQNIHPHIVLFAVGYQQFEVLPYFCSLLVLFCFHLLYYFGDVDWVLYFFVVIREGNWVDRLSEYF